MDYSSASRIRKTGLGNLITDRLVSGQSIGKSIGGSISDSIKAKATGIKEAFDPMRIVKAATGGSNAATAIFGRLTGRSTESIKYFTGRSKGKKVSRSKNSRSSVALTGTELFDPSIQSLNKILDFMQQKREEDSEYLQTMIDYEQFNENLRQDRHDEVMEAFLQATKAKRKADEDMKREFQKREAQYKKEIEQLKSGAETAPIKVEPKKQPPTSKQKTEAETKQKTEKTKTENKKEDQQTKQTETKQKVEEKKTTAADKKKDTKRTAERQREQVASNKQKETAQKQRKEETAPPSAPAPRPKAAVSETAKRVAKTAAGIAATGLVPVLAKAESQNYNQLVYPKKGKNKPSTAPLTDMKISEVLQLQDEMIKSGDYPSSAVGKYQIIRGTLQDAIKFLNIDMNEKFDEKTQDLIYRRYLISGKRPEIENFVAGKSDDIQAAQLALAKEFASFGVPYDILRPKGKNWDERLVKRGESYYIGSAGNKASVSPEVSAKALLEERDLRKSGNIQIQPKKDDIGQKINDISFETLEMRRLMKTSTKNAMIVVNNNQNTVIRKQNMNQTKQEKHPLLN